MEDFISQYLTYIDENNTETPMIYHRWCCISMLGAFLGRQFEFQLGHLKFYPTKYIMLIGTAGARKSGAITRATSLLAKTGYKTFSADRSSKEKFLLDLAGDDLDEQTVLDKNLFGEDYSGIREMYIACDEFNDFIGTGNYEFISILGSLWNYEREIPYTNRIKNGKSVIIPNPTLSILGGNTPVSFARAFPPELISQGFFSRLLLIYSTPTGKKLSRLRKNTVEETNEIIKELNIIKSKVYGVADITETAFNLLDKIYNKKIIIQDQRFESYYMRRYSHLIKLCLIATAANRSKVISENNVIYANTVLTHAERLMPRALGEFGKSKHSDVTHKLMQVLSGANRVLSLKELWTAVHTDLDKINDLVELIKNLIEADKIISTKGGFLEKRQVVEQEDSDIIDWSILTDEERNM